MSNDASVPRVSAVPRRLRLVCAVSAAVVLAVMSVVALLLKQSSTGVVAFGTADQVAMAGLGVVLAGGILAFGRPRVDADAETVVVRNVVGRHELPWSVVREVRFDRGSAWATLVLVNGEEVAVLAVQAVDKQRAVAAVEGLRALLAASRAGIPAAGQGE